MKSHASILSRPGNIPVLPAIVLVVAILLISGLRQAHAQQEFGFDPQQTGTSPGSGGGGQWDNQSTANWVLISGSGDVVWDNGGFNGALFNTTTNANPTVTIVGGVTASSLIFGSGSNGTFYVLTGGTLTLEAHPGTGPVVAVSGPGVIINSPILTPGVLGRGILFSSSTTILGGTNSYEGSTNIAPGTLLFPTTPKSLSFESDFAVSGTLALNGQSSTIGSLSGTGVVTNAFVSGTTPSGASPATLTVGGDQNTTEFDGVIQDGGTNASLSLTITGGKLTLTGSNTYTGITTIGGLAPATLSISSDANLGAVPAAPVATEITLNGGTLETTGSFTLNSNRGITVTGNGGTIDVESDSSSAVTYGGSIIGTAGGDFTKEGPGTLALTGSSDIGTGDLRVEAGALTITGTATFSDGEARIATFIATASVTVDGTGAAWLNGSNGVDDGFIGPGTINVQNGGFFSAPFLLVGDGPTSVGRMLIQTSGSASTTFATIGYASGSVGSVDVTGAGSFWNTDPLTVGLSGSGQLIVENNALVSATGGLTVGEDFGSIGNVFVQTSGTLVSGSAVIGQDGTGQVTVQQFGFMSASNGIIVGQNSDGNGSLTVQESGSLSTTSAVIGASGTGQFVVQFGAGPVILTGSLIAGENSTGVGFVTVQSTGPISAADAVIGESGSASLVLQFGGGLSAAGGFIVAENSNSIGNVMVHDGGAITTGSAVIGESGSAQLTMFDGGVLTATSGFVLGQNSNSFGGVNIQTSGSVGTTTAIIGESGTGQVTLGNSGFFSASTGIIIGADTGGVGAIAIQDGGMLTSGSAIIARAVGSQGTVLVTGLGSTWTISGPLFVGGNDVGPGGTALLTIQNSGVVSALATTIWTGGTLNIGQNYTLSSPLTFNGGTLQAGANTTFTNNATIAAAGVTVDTQNYNMPETGVLSGPGALTKIGTGDLIMDTVNTYSGGTFLTAGGIGLGVNSNATGGPVGASTLFVTGNGNLFSSGADRQLPNAINIGGGNTLTIIDDPTGGAAHNLGLTGPISGGGGLTMNSTRTLTLTGPGSYSGGTIINAGTVVVNNPTALGTGNVAVLGGVLTADPQPINVGGNYLQAPGGTLLLHVNGPMPGQYDFLNVNGSTSLAGTLTLQAPPGLMLTGGDRLFVVLSKGDITGRFDTVNFGGLIQPGTILSPKIVYQTHDVIFEAAQGSFTFFAKTKNEEDVAKALDKLPFHSKADRVLRFLDSQPVGRLTQELNDIAPAGLSSIYEISFANANTQQNNLENRMQDIRYGSTGFNSALFVTGNTEITKGYDGKNVLQTGNDKNPYPAPIPSGNRLGVFISGNGDFVNVGHDSNARGYDFTTGGVTLGVDYRVTDNFAVGVALGYANTTTSLDSQGSVDVNSGRGGVYATLFNNSGGFYMNTYAGGGFNSYDTRRRGLLADATGATNGAEFNSFIGAGYDVHVGGLTFGPIASVDYTYVDFNGFTERGSVAPLRIVSQNQDSLRTNAGIKLAYPFTAGGMVITPQLRASWQHEFAYSATPVYSEFNDTSDAFKVFGPKIGRDSALLEAGFRVQLTRTVATFLNYDGKINPDYTAHAVNGGVDVSF